MPTQVSKNLARKPIPGPAPLQNVQNHQAYIQTRGTNNFPPGFYSYLDIQPIFTTGTPASHFASETSKQAGINQKFKAMANLESKDHFRSKTVSQNNRFNKPPQMKNKRNDGYNNYNKRQQYNTPQYNGKPYPRMQDNSNSQHHNYNKNMNEQREFRKDRNRRHSTYYTSFNTQQRGNTNNFMPPPVPAPYKDTQSIMKPKTSLVSSLRNANMVTPQQPDCYPQNNFQSQNGYQNNMNKRDRKEQNKRFESRYEVR